MRDPASLTIDRHEPTIPDDIQGELSISEEYLKTKIKNSFILKYCNVGQVKRWVKQKPKLSTSPPKVITHELLRVGLAAVERCCGDLIPHHLEYLARRDIDNGDIGRFRMCSTQNLCQQLSSDEVHNLSLRVADHIVVDDHAIDGISIPFVNGDGIFCGFCTRILGQPSVKYSITIPSRYCFGVDLSRGDEIYVVEGVFDAIRMIKWGFNCMALGDSQPNYYKMFIANKFGHVNLLFDNDYSGLLGAAKSHVILDEMFGRSHDKMSLLVPDGHDPSTMSVSAWGKYNLKQVASNLTRMGREI